jgi:hypothetical protein
MILSEETSLSPGPSSSRQQTRPQRAARASRTASDIALVRSVSGVSAVFATAQVVAAKIGCLLRTIRYQDDPAASPAMSAVPPKAEVNSERWRLRYGRCERICIIRSRARSTRQCDGRRGGAAGKVRG